MFEDKRLFKPLQAADILAWQVQNHMRRTVMIGKPPDSTCHEGFTRLRHNRPMDLGFYSSTQIKKVFDASLAFHREHGRWPWGFSPIGGKVIKGRSTGV